MGVRGGSIKNQSMNFLKISDYTPHTGPVSLHSLHFLDLSFLDPSETFFFSFSSVTSVLGGFEGSELAEYLIFTRLTKLNQNLEKKNFVIF